MFPAPTLMAFLSGSGEISSQFYWSLALPRASRPWDCCRSDSVIVELTVPDGWPVHITWAAMALGIMAWGPGRLSIDYLLRRLLQLSKVAR